MVIMMPQCKKSVTSTGSELPPETTSGKNTFGCLINGKVFVPKGFGAGSNHDCYYQQLYPGFSGNFFHVSGQDLTNSNNVSEVFINCDSIKLVENQSYVLQNETRGNCVGNYQIVTGSVINRYQTNKIVTGLLLIKKFDQTNHIVSGTFSYNAVNSAGDTLKITEGRFDMNFTQ